MALAFEAIRAQYNTSTQETYISGGEVRDLESVAKAFTWSVNKTGAVTGGTITLRGSLSEDGNSFVIDTIDLTEQQENWIRTIDENPHAFRFIQVSVSGFSGTTSPTVTAWVAPHPI